MMGMVVLVMAMAMVNVASLLLVRAAGGCGSSPCALPWALPTDKFFRQLLAEGLVLGLTSAALGLLIAPRALAALIRWMAGRDPDSAFSAMLDWRVLLFTLAAALLASLLFSLAPAVQFWNPRLRKPSSSRPGPVPMARCSSAAPAWRSKSASACC